MPDLYMCCKLPVELSASALHLASSAQTRLQHSPTAKSQCRGQSGLRYEPPAEPEAWLEEVGLLQSLSSSLSATLSQVVRRVMSWPSAMLNFDF